MPGAGRLERALAAIDAANRDDPHTLAVRGAVRPKELAHAELASEWVLRLRPDASEELRLAARAHHLRRWEIPRSVHPAGRQGYHRWRRALQDLHAERVGAILREVGYGATAVARVQELVRKRGLGTDPEAQALEDALCLVFLETQLAAITERLEPARLEDVLRKTLAKMSLQAVALARKLPLGASQRELVDRSIAALE
jgi:hypothetical protein